MQFLSKRGEDRLRSGSHITKRACRNRTPAFKANVALAALKGEKTLGELAQQCDVSMAGDPESSTCANPLRHHDRLQGTLGRSDPRAHERAARGAIAPDFVLSLFWDENLVFNRPENMEHLLDGLRLAGCAP